MPLASAQRWPTLVFSLYDGAAVQASSLRPPVPEFCMSTLAVTDDIFFNRAGLDRTRTESIVSDALSGADDGELYLEYSQSESLSGTTAS